MKRFLILVVLFIFASRETVWAATQKGFEAEFYGFLKSRTKYSSAA